MHLQCLHMSLTTRLQDSYGGAVGSQAIGHLLSTTRPSPSDAAGKVLHLVYVAALIPQEGETMAALNELITAETPVEQRLPVEVIDGKLVCKEEIKDLFYRKLLRARKIVPA